MKHKISDQAMRAAARQSLVDAGLAGAKGLLALVGSDKDLDEASRDAVLDFTVRQARCCAEEGLNKVLAKSVSSCSNKMLRNVAASKIPSPVVKFVTEGSSCVVKFLNGELTGDECFDSLADLSVTTLGGVAMTTVVTQLAPELSAFAIGGIALLPMAATMLGGAIASGVYTGLKTFIERDARVAEERERRITSYCREACKQLRDYRRQIERQFKKSNKEFYDLMVMSLAELDSDDADLVLNGGNRILQALGRKVLASSVDDFDRKMTEDLDAPLVVGRRC